MADYEYNSKADSDLVEGLDVRDLITVYGNHTTVMANGGNDTVSVFGGRHNEGIWIGDEDNLIYGGAGNDSILVKSRGASVYGEAGNDTVNIQGDYLYADGGDGDDVFYEAYNVNIRSHKNVTITGGAGTDTIRLQPIAYQAYSYDGIKFQPYRKGTMQLLVTDFSNEDVLRFDGANNAAQVDSWVKNNWSHEVVNGNIVIADNISVKTIDGEKFISTVDPNFSITLQGVSDISQVADAKFYYYYSYNTSDSRYSSVNGEYPVKYTTFGEMFGVSSSSTNSTSATSTVEPVTTTTTNETVEPATDTVTSGGSTTTTKTTTTTTTEETTIVETVEPVETVSSATETVSTETTTPTTGSGDTIINNYYYGDYNNMSGNNGTIINQSSIGGGVTNNTNIDNSVTLIKEGDTYTYNGGNKVIENYQQGEVIALASDYQGIDLNGNSFFVKSSTGDLEIKNARDKFIGYGLGNNDVAVYSYLAGQSGVIDGRDKFQIEMMIGADNADNNIFAGSGGSSLWGGIGGNDTLNGGDGYDEFFFTPGSGNDVMQNVGDNDLVNLLGVNLSQISGVEINIGQVNVNFFDGGSLQINGGNGVAYRIAEGTFSVNQSTKEWSVK